MLKNEERAPAGALANSRNLGLFALATVWLTAQIKAAFPITGEGTVELQQMAILIGLGAFGSVVGFCTSVWRNVTAGKKGAFAARLGGWISRLLP